MAIRRFNMLERKLHKNNELHRQYSDFMTEYEQLGHMVELSHKINDLSDTDAYYIPHHAVLKASSLTTKLRCVFDASAKTTTGLSLNRVHYPGPTVQSELFDILIRFRQYTYVMTADISKMYRQILIDIDQRRFHRIFWRVNPSDELKCYELTTVTYGVAASPFLATRCLLELAINHQNDYPLACEVIRDSFYVDDLLTGSNSKPELLQLQHDITSILASAGLELRKWLSNSPELCNKFKVNSSLGLSILHLAENEPNKTLGIFWNATLDVIQYCVQTFDKGNIITKRSILSTISQLFDPMSLVGPIIIRAKFILQLIWKEDLEWDQPVSEGLKKKWQDFCDDLSHLHHLKIDRHVLNPEADYFELHTFVDSSESGYGACLYIRCRHNGNYSSKLLCAKSKVAPIKQITLPRLELCAAVLGAKLAKRIMSNLKLIFSEIYYWTDSSVTFHWINGSPHNWKTFVANRVSVIQHLTNVKDWYHIRSEDNPADCISRGTTSKQLLTNNLWWEGPSWLKLYREYWPKSDITHNLYPVPEQKTTICHLITKRNEFDIFSKYSCLRRLVHVVVHCRRFIHNIRYPNDRKIGSFEIIELNESLGILLRISQIQSFENDYQCLETKGSVNNCSKILSLKPFLDKNHLMRVGGRLVNAHIPYDRKYPVLLHNKHPLTRLILESEHKRLLHCGPQQLLYSVRQSYWPISGRNLARMIVHKCVTCFKVEPVNAEYVMGNLPTERVNRYTPFTNTGCDYTGPIFLKDRKSRKSILSKAWICIFVCMSTKAMHIDVVTDLTTQAFLACFRRFIARRGKPSVIFCDNSKTFVGARAELSSFFQKNSNNIKLLFNKEGIEWKFIPPQAPNFGGLWEAGVKSVKCHLKRIIGNAHLHFEDFYTILTQIEAVLNSRPLSPLSSSPDDYTPLTPGHFLISKPLTSLPEPDFTDIPQNPLNHYKRLQQLYQHFWRRWSIEYISQLQSRQKWSQNAQQLLKVDSLVVIKENNLPPLLWKTGRVKEVHPGSDGIIRVVTVQLSDGSAVKRPVRKLCVLPIYD